MQYLAKGAGVAPVSIPALGRSLSPLKDLKAFCELRKIVCRYRPHILHTHTAKAGTLGRLAAMSVGRKIATVHTFHGHVFHGYFNRWKSALFIWIERVLARFTDRIVVISKSQRREICAVHRIAGPDRVRIVPLGFELEPFRRTNGPAVSQKRSRLSPKGGEKSVFLVGCIGRLTPIKNHPMLIDAMAHLKKEGRLDRLAVAIVGGGELEGMLKTAVLEKGLEDRIRFSGWHQDMPAVYAALDAVVLTSRNEGTPVALIEAMAAGKPVVATDVGGVGDLLGPVTGKHDAGFCFTQRGLLVPPEDHRVLAEALAYLQKQPAAVEEMVDSARQWVFEHHGMDRLTTDLKRLYQELCQRRPETGGPIACP
jgi:glycosyltransferase involved in cell wall biosynthesis